MRLAMTIFLLLVLGELKCQINVIPYVGNDAMHLRTVNAYTNGGLSIVPGIEFEVSPTFARRSTVLSLVADLSYAENRFRNVERFSAYDYYNNSYSRRVLDIETRYLKAAILARLVWQPYPLIEHFHFAAGAGIEFGSLLEGIISEEYSGFHQSGTRADEPPPQPLHFVDRRQLTQPWILFDRFDLGIDYKRIYLGFRITFSITDPYGNVLDEWDVPDPYSNLRLYHSLAGGKFKELHSGFIIGLRVFK